jgi:hypothetical protein
VLKEPRVLKELKVLLQTLLDQQVLKVLKDLQEHKVRQDQLVLKEQ